MNCMRRLSRCIDRLVANPTSAAAAMKTTIDPGRLASRAGAAASAATPRFARAAVKRGRKASHGGDDASSIRIGFAVLKALRSLLLRSAPPAVTILFRAQRNRKSFHFSNLQARFVSFSNCQPKLRSRELLSAEAIACHGGSTDTRNLRRAITGFTRRVQAMPK